MGEYIAIIIGTAILMFIFIIAIVAGMCGNHKDFISKAKSIHQGMSKSQVLSILGTPTSTEADNEKEILIWEKSQWKGIQNGGTLIRALKVTIVENRVTMISTKNLDKSTFW